VFYVRRNGAHSTKLSQPSGQPNSSKPRSTARAGVSATPQQFGSENPGKRLASLIGHNDEEAPHNVAIHTRIRTNAVLLSSSSLSITIELDSYAKIDIINHTFALKHNLQQVANKSPRLQYLNGKAHKNLGVFEVPIQLSNNQNRTRTLTIPCTAIRKMHSKKDSPLLLGIPTLSKEAVLLFPKDNR